MELLEGAKCCEGTISVNAADLPFRQKLVPGTTAWRKSYRRRNTVEGVNGMLKGGFVNIQEKFFRVFGLTKLTFLLTFTIAGYNVACIRSFKARTAADAEARDAKKKHRATRRKGTYTDLLGGGAEGPVPDPPPDLRPVTTREQHRRASSA
ncbi:MAG: hypothetical protein U0V56_01845 [Actinomycetota bacterium]